MGDSTADWLSTNSRQALSSKKRYQNRLNGQKLLQHAVKSRGKKTLYLSELHNSFPKADT